MGKGQTRWKGYRGGDRPQAKRTFASTRKRFKAVTTGGWLHTGKPYSRYFPKAFAHKGWKNMFKKQQPSAMVQLVRAAAHVDAAHALVDRFNVPATFVSRHPNAIEARRKAAIRRRMNGVPKKSTRGTSKRAGKR